jgi:hypothetical protein
MTSTKTPENGSFSPSRTFWGFLSQILGPDRSCREILRKFLAWLAIEEGRTASPKTTAYCKARARLPLSRLQEAHAQVLAALQPTTNPKELWYGRPVIVADGSSASMPDTPKNQKAFPQPKNQEPGCGFPIIRIVAFFSLFTGAILAFAKAALLTHERTLFRSLWDILQPGDVILADCGFCSYADFFLLSQRRVDCVMRNHPRRNVGIRPLKRLSKGDRIIQWLKMRQSPEWLNKAQWLLIPDTIPVREISFSIDLPGFRTHSITIVTTLLNPKLFPKHAFAELYRKRWMAELFLRDIKITMGFDVLRCKSPLMIEKELCMHIIAYNLIRALICQAAHTHHLSPSQISFKGTLATARQWAPLLAAAHLNKHKSQLLFDLLLQYLARDPLPNRPNRVQPRARKRRPKNYQLLNKPRHLFVEILHRNHYTVNKPLS